MARITVEDCLDNVENRFELVLVATKRSRELATGGKDPMLDWENDKPTVMALREIAAGMVDNNIINAAPAPTPTPSIESTATMEPLTPPEAE